MSASLDTFDIDLRQPLGAGSHGMVYWGEHRTLGQEVAIKVVHAYAPDPIAKEELAIAIDLERRAFEELLAGGSTHPNVMDLVAHFTSPASEAMDLGLDIPDAGHDGEVHFFVASYLEGASLTDTTKERQSSGTNFEDRELMDVASSVSEGLRFLHDQGIVHRDVKPCNLMHPGRRGDLRELKLIDFSVAGVANGEHAAAEESFSARVGTIGYTAPEVLQLDDSTEKNVAADESYSVKCDIFSLGCTLHTMLAGAPPTVDFSNGSAHVTTTIPEDASDWSRRFVESMLAVDPADRPTILEILAECAA